MSYILPPAHTLSTLKIGALTFKQAPQAIFGLGGWDNMHCTGKEGETRNVNSGVFVVAPLKANPSLGLKQSHVWEVNEGGILSTWTFTGEK